MRKRIMFLLFVVLIFVSSGCSNGQNPIGLLDKYNKLWEKQDFVKMYQLLSVEDKELITQEEFQKVYEEFYEALGVKEIRIENLGDNEELKDKIELQDTVNIPIVVTFNTSHGEKVSSMDVVFMKKEVDGKTSWNIDWDYNLIYQGMEEGDKVKEIATSPVRGEILDRNNKKLATNGEIIQVGIVPGRLGEMKEEIINEIAETFEISKDFINDRLSLSWVKEDTFVDILKISIKDLPLIERIHTKNNGATYKVIKDRVYPYEKIAAHLIGYLGYLNEEELKELEPMGFTADSKVGRTGLEKIFDEQLRGTPGKKVVILNSNGVEKEVLSEQKMENGKDLTLTVDIELQTKLYNQVKDEQGTATCMNYKTGEVMALVSAPSYDPNAFILGISSEKLSSMQEDERKPLLNRFTKVYVPGSGLKPVTVAIALNEDKIDDSFSIGLSGKKWQKDASWGDHFITRVTDPGMHVDLEKAMIYSDNIYFAQVALQIGAEDFVEKAKEFGIGVPLDLRYGIEDSQLASGNKITKDVLLADTGYGQGEVLMSILNLPKAYSVFVNEGNIIEPKLIADESEPKMKKIISEEVAEKVFTLMTKVVQDKDGTAHEAQIPGRIIAAKTGTAEINSVEDANVKEELGWFTAIVKDEEQPYITSMMIEDVQDRNGSHFVVPKVKKFIESYLQ
ncbi:MAG: penicillin-binding transpeptidase domain-containing protein [Eubacteriales bacterium]